MINKGVFAICHLSKMTDSSKKQPCFWLNDFTQLVRIQNVSTRNGMWNTFTQIFLIGCIIFWVLKPKTAVPPIVLIVGMFTISATWRNTNPASIEDEDDDTDLVQPSLNTNVMDEPRETENFSFPVIEMLDTTPDPPGVNSFERAESANMQEMISLLQTQMR